MVEYSPKILASEEKATTTTAITALVPGYCSPPVAEGASLDEQIRSGKKSICAKN